MSAGKPTRAELARRLLAYAEADETNAAHLGPGPVGAALAARAAALRAAAEALAPRGRTARLRQDDPAP